MVDADSLTEAVALREASADRVGVKTRVSVNRESERLAVEVAERVVDHDALLVGDVVPDGVDVAITVAEPERDPLREPDGVPLRDTVIVADASGDGVRERSRVGDADSVALGVALSDADADGERDAVGVSLAVLERECEADALRACDQEGDGLRDAECVPVADSVPRVPKAEGDAVCDREIVPVRAGVSLADAVASPVLECVSREMETEAL